MHSYDEETELRTQGDQGGKSSQDKIPERRVLHRERALEIGKGSPQLFSRVVRAHACDEMP